MNYEDRRRSGDECDPHIIEATKLSFVIDSLLGRTLDYDVGCQDFLV